MTQLHRVLGYCGTLVLHMGNGLAMLLALEGDIMKNPDPDLKRFHMMQYRYITIWNLIFQSTYAALSLACELYDYLKLTQYIEFRQRLEQFRNSYFCAIVWPITVSIFIIFWPIYIYDRDLIFPSYIDKVLSQVSNQVMHTAIIPVVLWEITYNQRKPPKSHGENFNIFSQLVGTYYVALLFTHWQLAAWPYPIFNYMSFPQIAIFLLFLWVVSWGTYYLQWSLSPIMANLVKKKSE